MPGGVRTESSTSLAPPSARSTAISAPEFPVPTTRTRRPRYGAALRYSRGVDDLDAVRAGPVGRRGHVAQTRGDHHAVGAQRAVRRSLPPNRRRPGRCARPRPRCGRRARGRPHRARRYSATRSRAGHLPKRRGNRVARQAREPAHRVQVETVVAARPDRADLGALEHDDVLAGACELGRRRQPGRTGADHDDHSRVLHDGAAPAQRARSAELDDQRRLAPVRVERRDPQGVRALARSWAAGTRRRNGSAPGWSWSACRVFAGLPCSHQPTREPFCVRRSFLPFAAESVT